MNDGLIEKTVKKIEQIAGSAALTGLKESKAIPSMKEIEKIISDLHALLFPSYFAATSRNSHALLWDVSARLEKQIELAGKVTDEELDAKKICSDFIERLPEIYEKLLKDIEALFEGDPAAKSREMVLICYPGFYVISIYRFAHELYRLGVPLLARMMTEHAHGKTGVDIHAGAEIGEYFFIDHGTGIVIGETTVIGDRVKLYQGVTLGAKSFKTDDSGNPVKDIKRHPNIGNNVVIYANATILGGDTYVGDGSVIGGNVWLTSSVPAGSKVYYSASDVSKK